MNLDSTEEERWYLSIIYRNNFLKFLKHILTLTTKEINMALRKTKNTTSSLIGGKTW